MLNFSGAAPNSAKRANRSSSARNLNSPGSPAGPPSSNQASPSLPTRTMSIGSAPLTPQDRLRKQRQSSSASRAVRSVGRSSSASALGQAEISDDIVIPNLLGSSSSSSSSVSGSDSGSGSETSSERSAESSRTGASRSSSAVDDDTGTARTGAATGDLSDSGMYSSPSFSEDLGGEADLPSRAIQNRQSTDSGSTRSVRFASKKQRSNKKTKKKKTRKGGEEEGILSSVWSFMFGGGARQVAASGATAASGSSFRSASGSFHHSSFSSTSTRSQSFKTSVEDFQPLVADPNLVRDQSDTSPSLKRAAAAAVESPAVDARATPAIVVGEDGSPARPVENLVGPRSRRPDPMLLRDSDLEDVLPRTNLLSGVILCCWDNISGPKVEHAWLPMSSHSQYGDADMVTAYSDDPPRERSGTDPPAPQFGSNGVPQFGSNGGLAEPRGRSSTIHNSDAQFRRSSSQESVFSLPGGPLPVPREVQMYAARHVLAGELARSDPKSEDGAAIETKFHVFSEVGFAVSATTFTAAPVPVSQSAQSMAHSLAAAARNGQSTPGITPQMAAQMAAAMSIGSSSRTAPVQHSLCLLLSKEHLERYLAIHSVVEDRLLQLAKKLRALLNSADTRQEAIEMFTAYIHVAVHNIECVFDAGLPYVALNKTLWWDPWGHVAIRDESAAVNHSGRLFLNPRFLALCVSSHLSTMGCTVVIGSDLQQVNLLVDSLLVFSLVSGDRRRAAHATTTSEEFIPGLSVQGLYIPPSSRASSIARSPSTSSFDMRGSFTKTPDRSASKKSVATSPAPLPGRTSRVHEHLVIQSQLPVTIIDLDRSRVDQTHPYHEFLLLRAAFQEYDLAAVIPGAPLPDNRWTATLADGLFTQVRQPAPLVVECLNISRTLPTALRGGYLASTLKEWCRLAVCLMKYVEAEVVLHVRRHANSQQQPANPPPVDDDKDKGENPHSDSITLEAETVTRIRNELGMRSNENWSIILAIAERMSPGIYVVCAGDPAAIEEKFLELFESF